MDGRWDAGNAAIVDLDEREFTGLRPGDVDDKEIRIDPIT